VIYIEPDIFSPAAAARDSAQAVDSAPPAHA
jgi:hypothetical protein